MSEEYNRIDRLNQLRNVGESIELYTTFCGDQLSACFDSFALLCDAMPGYLEQLITDQSGNIIRATNTNWGDYTALW